MGKLLSIVGGVVVCLALTACGLAAPILIDDFSVPQALVDNFSGSGNPLSNQALSSGIFSATVGQGTVGGLADREQAVSSLPDNSAKSQVQGGVWDVPHISSTGTAQLIWDGRAGGDVLGQVNQNGVDFDFSAGGENTGFIVIGSLAHNTKLELLLYDTANRTAKFILANSTGSAIGGTFFLPFLDAVLTSGFDITHVAAVQAIVSAVNSGGPTGNAQIDSIMYFTPEPSTFGCVAVLGVFGLGLTLRRRRGISA